MIVRYVVLERIQNMKRFGLDEYKEEIIKMYIEDKFSCEKIAKVYNASLSGIYDALKRWNVNTRDLSRSHRIYRVDENYFDVIDTEEKAYWLGFIYADGFVTSPHNFGIALSKNDKLHLEKLLESLKSNYPIHEYISKSNYGQSEYVRLLINNNNIYRQLIKKGVKLNKSLILDFPDNSILSSKLYRHFIRGYFDGDGSLVLSKHSINFKICGTKEFLSKLIDIFNEVSEYNLKHNLFKRKKDEKNNFYISYGGALKIFTILSYLYENSVIYLDRKMKKYEQLKEYITINHSRVQ